MFQDWFVIMRMVPTPALRVPLSSQFRFVEKVVLMPPFHVALRETSGRQYFFSANDLWTPPWVTFFVFDP